MFLAVFSRNSNLIVSVVVLSALCLPSVIYAGPNDSDWVQLFNGKDLSDWDIKIAKQNLNVNKNNTFKVVDGVISVDYSEWTTFDKEHGHAANKTRAYSYYLVRAEYQIGTTQVSGGPSWAIQNNGLMLHSQSMASMGKDQDFPISMEAQILGSGNGNYSTTMNLCTPGTGFRLTPTTGAAEVAHCKGSAGNTKPAPGTWNWVSASVMADSIIRHYVGKSTTGTPVLTYYKTTYLKGDIVSPPDNAPADNTPLKSGYIAIQAESHPFKFRKLELLNLEGCMTSTNPNYKTYFVKHEAAACNVTGMDKGLAPGPQDFAMEGNKALVRGSGAYTLDVLDLSGKAIRSLNGSEAGVRELSVERPGVYLVRLRNAVGAFIRRAVLL